MAIYKGFTTKSFNFQTPTTIVGTIDNDFGPYTVTDKNLVIMDLLNNFYIKKGEKLMNPNFGCSIWDRLFDPLTKTLKDEIFKEIDNIVRNDPRINVLNRVTIDQSPDGAGLLLDIQIVLKDTNELVNLNIAFDGTTGTASTSVNY
jgi:phage baseplate assembly protein W